MKRRVRGFEVVTGYEDKGINLPIRMSFNSAGYDFEAAEEVAIPSLFRELVKALFRKGDLTNALKDACVPTEVPTGIRCYMEKDEYLGMYGRSSSAIKKFLMLVNGVAVVDSDYYSQEHGAGHIRFYFINIGLTTRVIKKGERIGQGIFHKYLNADEGAAREKEEQRSGGVGSTK